jgi:hypothetical protein
MKKIYLLTAMAFIAGTIAQAQQVWDNFEDTRYGEYTFVHGPLISYGENPDPSGVNTSPVCATYTRNPSELFDVIVLTSQDGLFENVISYASGTKTMSIDVWSPVPNTRVQITLENNALAQGPFPIGRHSEYFAETTTTNAWETLEFELLGIVQNSGVTPDFIDQIVILFEPNSNTGETYYWDNLVGPELINDPCSDVSTDFSILNDFECQQNVNFTFSTSGINFQRVSNPDTQGNTSAFVASYGRNGNAAGGNDVIIGSFTAPLLLTPSSVISLDVWAPSSGIPVRLALQNGAGDEIIAVDANTASSEAWETLNFDVGSVSAATDIERFVILFNPETDGFESYFFDNFRASDLVSVEELAAVTSFNAFPNPSQGQTTFEYELVNSASVAYTIFDLTGKVVDQQVLGQQPAGKNRIIWNANSLSNGLYFYQFSIDSQVASGKIMLNR